MCAKLLSCVNNCTTYFHCNVTMVQQHDHFHCKSHVTNYTTLCIDFFHCESQHNIIKSSFTCYYYHENDDPAMSSLFMMFYYSLRHTVLFHKQLSGTSYKGTL